MGRERVVSRKEVGSDIKLSTTSNMKPLLWSLKPTIRARCLGSYGRSEGLAWTSEGVKTFQRADTTAEKALFLDPASQNSLADGVPSRPPLPSQVG